MGIGPRRRRRRELPDADGVDNANDPWEKAARTSVARWSHLDAGERARLLSHARTFDRTVHWESIDDLEVTSPMRATVATHACLLTVNREPALLRDVSSVIVAPTSVVRTTRHRDGPVVSEGTACVLGEAMLHGPVRIAWDRVTQEATDSTTSVLLHEFAHKVDMADGASDGLPPLGSRDELLSFTEIIDGALRRLRRPGGETPLRRYGANNRQELFAVATEAFFLQSGELAEAEPDLYAALSDFYRQDPAAAGGVGSGLERPGVGDGDAIPIE